MTGERDEHPGTNHPQPGPHMALSFRPPVRATDRGVVLEVADDERDLIRRLIDELRDVIAPEDDHGSPPTSDVAARLWPTVYPDDPDREAEYQRLMSDELLASRLGAIEQVHEALADPSPTFDAIGANALMRSLNTIRLVLGTMIGITEDDDELDDSPEYQLYAYLSWLLEWTVRAM